MPTQDYAVFTEFSPGDKALNPGWNTRVFTDVDSKQGNGIRCDSSTGILTLAPGAYHITGQSTVTYNSGGEPAEMSTIRSPASAGYCRLRIYDPKSTANTSDLRSIPNDDPSVICIGSVCTANMSPSLFEAYFTTEDEAQILLEHQSGSNPSQIFLRVYTAGSRWHAMARIALRRI
jgi:hypothetical protein